MRDFLRLGCACLLMFLTQPGVAGDVKAGKEKSQACAACHAADGNSTNPAWPKLAGQGEAYLATQLHYFRNGERKNDLMSPMAAGLSDEDISDLAAYFSAQELLIGQTRPENLESGARVYRSGNADTGVPACMACHDPKGSGNPAAEYPALSGQHAAYVEAQLKAYRSGQRVNMVMQTIANMMSDDEIRAVADYVQGLH